MLSQNFLNPHYNIDFQDLYSASGLIKIQQKFLDFVKNVAPEYFQQYHLDNAKNSSYLIELGKILEVFITELFIINQENDLLRARSLSYKKVCEARKEYIQRHIAKKYSPLDLASLPADFDYKKILADLAINFAKIDDIEIALATKIIAQQDLPIIEKYCLWALFDERGCDFHRDGALFILPQKIDLQNLITKVQKRKREGFDLTDKGCSPLRAFAETNYCIFCHNQGKDSCRTGFVDKQRGDIKIDELGIELNGCPLDEKISEMNFLKNNGFTIASLAMAIIDNPMIAGTGHRICNDCMKSCIYQKQEPVDIPQIESRVLKDVLDLPYGFEIYSLLTRWNPLNIASPLPKENSGKKILVCGMGPAGYTLSHYLLNEGHEVVAIDGLKIEPLAPEISGVDFWHNKVNFIPIKNIADLYEPLSSRVITGFGGVAEYGITARFDKNYLKIIRLLLERRQNFAMYGGIRFGSSITDKIAFEEYGFDHIALCVGAGRPQFLHLENNFAKGVRLASDFLMSLQLTGAYQQQIFANLQIRTPIIVVGGGLTAVDSATEAQEYYKIQVLKFADKIAKFTEAKIDQDFFASLNDEEKIIADEFLCDANKIKNHEFTSNCKILYRKKMVDSPAYRLNHQELKNCLEEGVKFIENQDIVEIIIDEFKHIKAIKTKDGNIMECKTLLMAIGTMPNISFVLEDKLEFANDGKYLQEIFDENFTANANNFTNNLGGKNFSVITKIDKISQKAISFFGDLHPNFEGNVVKAMASAKNGYHQINQVLALLKNDNNKNNYRDYRADFLTKIAEIDRLADHVVAIKVQSKLLARQTAVGQIFRLHNLQKLAPEIAGQKLLMEGVAVTALAIDKEAGIISGIVVETGGSTSLIKNFKPQEPCIFMGPSGKPTEIPHNEFVVLIGGGRGNQPLTALAESFKANNCQILFFAGYRDEKNIVQKQRMQQACDSLIISIEDNNLSNQDFAKKYSEQNYFLGDVIESIKNYFATNHHKIDRIFAIGNDDLMHKIAQLRHENIVPDFYHAKYSITSLNAPMQCMMKGVCGQCLQKKCNKQGQVEYFYSCANQDQSSDELDFEHLHARARQNSLLEKTTKKWLKSILKN